jgi:hypothetical protein
MIKTNLQLRKIKKKSILFAFSFLFLGFNLFAQKDTTYFDVNWKECVKEQSMYYRIHPKKIKTKEAVGYKIEGVDSLYVIEDFYVNTNKLQFKGFALDKNAQSLVGNSNWYSENDSVSDFRDFNYNKKQAHQYKILDWQPIFYVNYSITIKSQFTGGMEFCLSCEDKSKLFLGLGYGISSYDNHYFGIPDAYLSLNTANWGFLKIGGSNRNLYSLAGLSLFNFIDLGFGYSYPLSQDKIPEIKGFTFGLTFRITNNKNAYGKLKIGF